MYKVIAFYESVFTRWCLVRYVVTENDDVKIDRRFREAIYNSGNPDHLQIEGVFDHIPSRKDVMRMRQEFHDDVPIRELRRPPKKDTPPEKHTDPSDELITEPMRKILFLIFIIQMISVAFNVATYYALMK